MSAHTYQNPGNVVAKMGHLNAAAELHRKGLEAKERSLGPDHPETLLVDLFFFSGGGEGRATFFKTFPVCDMILAVNMNEMQRPLIMILKPCKTLCQGFGRISSCCPNFLDVNKREKEEHQKKHISKVNTSHFIDVFVDPSSILLERTPVPPPPLHCNTNVLP